MDSDMVPATAPLHRFDPAMTGWYGNTIQRSGDTAWTIEAMHLNDGRPLYIVDLVGDVQLGWLRSHSKAGSSGRGGRHYGVHRGVHMQRTCRVLEKMGLAEWPDGVGGSAGGQGAAAGKAEAAAERTTEAVLPGGTVVRTVRRADGRLPKSETAGKLGRKAGMTLPRLTSAGRVVWMQMRLGLSPRDALVLALIWPRYKAAGYVVKSDTMILDNVWMREEEVKYAFSGLGSAGYIKNNVKTGKFLAICNADKVEPYGPMLSVIEEMVYAARAGEYVYGNTFDDAINEAYAKTVAALGERPGPRGGKDANAAK